MVLPEGQEQALQHGQHQDDEERKLPNGEACGSADARQVPQNDPDHEREQDTLPPAIQNGFKECSHYRASPIIFFRRRISDALSFSLCNKLCTNCSAEFSKKRLKRSRNALWRACSRGTLGL